MIKKMQQYKFFADMRPDLALSGILKFKKLENKGWP